MIVLERPGLYQGVYKRLLDKILLSADVTPEEAFITYLVKCEPPKAPTKAQINACKTWLWKELKLVRPRVILTFGKGPTSLLQKEDPAVGRLVELDYLPGTKLAPWESLLKVYQGPTKKRPGSLGKDGICELVGWLQELKETYG